MSGEKRDERRGILLGAARDVVLRFGYRKTTLEDVAAAAGVSRATIYNYFPNKQELLRGIITAELDGLREILGASFDPAAPPSDRLLSYVRARYAHLRQLRELYSVVLGLAREVLPLAMSEFDAFGEEQVAFLRALFDEGIATGHFRPMDSGGLALALWTAFRGFDEGLVFEDHDALAGSAELLVRAVLDGIEVRR